MLLLLVVLYGYWVVDVGCGVYVVVGCVVVCGRVLTSQSTSKALKTQPHTSPRNSTLNYPPPHEVSPGCV